MATHRTSSRKYFRSHTQQQSVSLFSQSFDSICILTWPGIVWEVQAQLPASELVYLFCKTTSSIQRKTH
ncbi:hypothetical protein ABBQ38_013113 [Trebouxia sp. C0009 RCD-2024]